AAQLIVRVAVEPYTVEDRAHDVKAGCVRRSDVQHEQPYALARLRLQRLVDETVVAAVEHGVGRRLGAYAITIEHVERHTIDLALLRVELGVELALDDRVLAVD